MTERDALLRAVCENPDDNLPRLVLADWLDEHDEPERAEFIRITCRLEELFREFDAGGGPKTHAKIIPLDLRAGELWMKFGASWYAELPQLEGISWGTLQFRWPRGLVSAVTADAVGLFVRHADAVMSAAPVATLTIRRVRGLIGLLGSPYLNRLRVLFLGNSGMNDRAAEPLLVPGVWDHLTRIDLRNNLLSTGMVRRLEQHFGKRVSAQGQRER
jgi:uncharacterized protein (TIGR02996 family)